MTYKIDGITVAQPTDGSWIDRGELGKDGRGKPSYPYSRSFELAWEYIDVADAGQIYGLFKNKEASGTHVVSLPAYDSLSWSFKEYSGTQMQEPTFDKYFEQHVSNFKVLIVNIRG